MLTRRWSRSVTSALMLTTLSFAMPAYAEPQGPAAGALPEAPIGTTFGTTTGGDAYYEAFAQYSEQSSTPGKPSTPEASGQAGSSAPAAADPCTYTARNAETVGWVSAARAISDLTETTASTGSWYEQSCPGRAVDLVGWAPPAEDTAEADAPLPSPVSLAEQAVTSVTVTTPDIVLDPFYLLDDGRHATLKNAQTWIWIDPAQWKTLTPKVEVGPVWVEATITPQTIHVDPNDGVTPPYSCSGPGTTIPASTPIDEASPTCSIQLTEPTDGDTWPVEVWVSYSASWEGFDGTQMVSGTLDDLVSAPTTIPLAVLTAKTELVDPNLD
ncbi:hypothetical protein [Cumulibacter soli]|uniref:hypothetical protein n=1 Tax=Cumulibacter soli TaxID=2546344 RepID=UPI0010681C6A|nr:hypothetical protein [Cumulibacter soli]